MDIRVESIVLCRQVRVDPKTQVPMDFLGVFNAISKERLPGEVPDEAMLCATISGVRHPTPLALSFTHYPAAQPEPVVIAHQPFTAPAATDPRRPVVIVINVGGVPLPQAGEYRFQILQRDSTVLGEKRLCVDLENGSSGKTG